MKSIRVVDRLENVFIISKMTSKVSRGWVKAPEVLIFINPSVSVAGIGIGTRKVVEVKLGGKTEVITSLG